MAAAFDINMLCNKLINIDIINELLGRYGVRIQSIHSIDNWQWGNENDLDSLNQVKSVLDSGKIVVVQLEKTSIKDLGIYIEKVSHFYLYTLWINTEGYQMLDCDRVTSENSKFYEEIYHEIAQIEKRNANTFDVVGIGLETDFSYNQDIEQTLKDSRNVIAWIIKNDIRDIGMKTIYKEKLIEGLKMTIFERVE